MAHSPHKRTKGCPMCNYYKFKDGGSQRVSLTVKRTLGKSKRVGGRGKPDFDKLGKEY